jgi:hypothetical protein
LTMSDAPHTADLGTRYRYRQEGAEAERERIIALLINVAVDQDALLELSPADEQAATIETVIATTYQLIALIKGEEK